MKVVDRFTLSALNMHNGAALLVRPIGRLQAQEYIRRNGFELVRPVHYTESRLVEALGVQPTEAMRVERGETFLVVEALDYRSFNFFLVHYVADADGVTEDGEALFVDPDDPLS